MPSVLDDSALGVGALYSYQVALSYCRRNPSSTKKELLLLYLLVHKLVGKYQLVELLDYPSPLPHSAEVFINRMCLNGFCLKLRNQSGKNGLDFYRLASGGLSVALDAYKGNLLRCIQEDVAVAGLMVPFATGGVLPVDEWAHWLSENFTARNHNQLKEALLLHMAAMEDCFLTLLHYMEPSFFFTPPQYEVTFQYGKLTSLEYQLGNRKSYGDAVLRCDAAYSVHHAVGVDNSMQSIIVEQDTRSQRLSVLKSKVERYLDMFREWFALPQQLPPFLLFSLFTASSRQELPQNLIRNTKARQTALGLGILADIYADEEMVDCRDVTIRQLLDYLDTFHGDCIEEYCRQVHALPSQYLDSPAYSFMDNFSAASSGDASVLLDRYTARRENIFSMCLELPDCKTYLLKGLSLSTMQNDASAQVLSFFPYESGLAARLASDLQEVNGGDRFQIDHYEAVHAFDGVIMRNCFFMTDGSCYAVEQVGDDLGGRVRSELYLTQKGTCFSLIMVLSQNDAYTLLPHFIELAGGVDAAVYCSLFSFQSDTGIVFSHLSRLSSFRL